MTAPEVSVVIPTHNREALLAVTLLSALRQQNASLEVIVVDDGSSDGTAAYVAGLHSDNLRLLRHPTALGVSAARNRGVAESAGGWVAFCDDDDLWAPEKLARQLAAARDTGRSWVYTGSINVTRGMRVVGGGPPPHPEEVMRRLPEVNVVPGGASGVMVSRAALEHVGLFDTGLQPMADWDLWLRLARTGPPACAPYPLVAYRVHAANMSLDTGRVEREFEVVAQRSGRADHAALFRYLGWWCVRVGRSRTALRYFTRAALRRQDGYPPAVFLADVSYVVRDAADALRLRYGARWLRRSLHRARAPEHVDWRAEGQRWVDALAEE